MRHGMRHRKFNMSGGLRRAMLMNLAKSVIDKESVMTTLPKAKEIRPIVEKFITKSSKYESSPLSTRRYLLRYFRGDNVVVKKLIDNLGARFKDRPGGYLRIMKCGFRSGDAAPMARIEFVDILDDQQDIINRKKTSPSVVDSSSSDSQVKSENVEVVEGEDSINIETSEEDSSVDKVISEKSVDEVVSEDSDSSTK